MFERKMSCVRTKNKATAANFLEPFASYILHNDLPEVTFVIVSADTPTEYQ
jgi:hypothetical protein